MHKMPVVKRMREFQGYLIRDMMSSVKQMGKFVNGKFYEKESHHKRPHIKVEESLISFLVK